MREITPEIQELSAVEATGHFLNDYFPAHAQRLFGGTSNIWAGFCTTLEERSFLDNAWPLNYSEIKPYYKDAAAILELPNEAYETPTKKLTEENIIIYKPYYKSPPVRFGEKYYSSLIARQNIALSLGTTCTKIVSNDNIVDSLVVQESTGDKSTERIVKAKQYVLACGGIGNPRLLLLGNLAPNSPVGHYFMEHPHIYGAGEVELKRELIDAVVSQGNLSHALQLSDSYNAENGLLSLTVSFGLNQLEERIFLGERQELYISPVTIRGEMLPQESNQISLTDTADRLQQSKTNVYFDFNYQELALKNWDAFARQLLALGIGRATTPPEFYPSITGGGHYVGTTRMGHAANESVVDSNCKLHELDNLYIAGSSIFPAAGAANPTFSIVAFALRLADHLAANLQG